MLLRTILSVGLLTATAVLPEPAMAGSEEHAAERIRLQDELERLAQKNQWKGVERSYTALTGLEVALRPEDHTIGAQAALSRGDMTVAHERLKKAIPEDYTPETASPAVATAAATLQGIESRYGQVSIVVSGSRVPALVRFEMPFTREERMSIELGREILGDNYRFVGLLPAGRYMVDGDFFEVEAGKPPLRITVKDH